MILNYILFIMLIFFQFKIKNIWINLVLIFFIFFNLVIQRKKIIIKEKKILESLYTEEEKPKLTNDIEIVYDEAKKKITEKLDKYKKVSKEIQHNFLAKSTELEYMNDLLQKKVSNLSTLDAIGKSVISELNLEKIIDIILDSYLVITRVEKIALYFWDNEKLEKKTSRGNFTLQKSSKNEENIKILEKVKYAKDYYYLAKSLKTDKDEVIIAPLISKHKELGIIILIKDISTKQFDKEEIQLILAITRHLAIAINNSIMYNVLAEKEKIEKEISLAADIQKNLLPIAIEKINNIRISEYFKPAKMIGGDFYDYFISPKNDFGILIGDVSGKGMPAALLMTLLRSIWKTLLVYEKYPENILTKLNKIIYSDMGNDMFSTLFYSLYKFEERTLYFSNAGHNPIIYYKSSENIIEEINVKGAAIGFIKNYEYKMKKMKISEDDILVYYTDGITEAKNEKNELFGKKKLIEIIMKNKNETPEVIKEKIIEEINEHEKMQNQADDITLIVIKVV